MLDAALSRMAAFCGSAVLGVFLTAEAQRTQRLRRELNNKAEALERAIEILEIERLSQIYVRADFLCRFFHAVNVVSRNCHDRRVVAISFELAKLFDRLQSIHYRHVQVDNNQAWPVTPCQIESLAPILSLKNAVAFYFKGALE